MSHPGVTVLAPGRTGNRLLDGLPEGAFSLLAPSLVRGSLGLKQPLMLADQPIRDVYFPATAMVSMIIAMEDGSEVKTALIGAEGMVGQVVSLGLDVGLQGAMCSARGEAWSLPARQFREALTSSHPLDSLIRRYTAVSIRQAAQLVACNALHPVAERLCRWLLMAHDRAGGGVFAMTQEFMGEMMGVRRQTVAVAAGALQGAGLITYSRGTIRVLDRARLEDGACECYATIKALYRRFLP